MMEASLIDPTEIVDFVDFWFGVKPHEYQEEFLVGCMKEKRVCGLWSRQSGKSTSISWYCLYMGLTNKNFKIIIIAPSQRQSSELYEKIRTIVNESDLVRPLIVSSSQTELKLMNGTRIVSLPCGPEGSTIRGFTGDIVIEEEAAGIKDKIDAEVITPMIASKQSYGQKIKIGTPKGKNHFYRSCYGKETEYKLFHFEWKRVLAAGQYNEKFIREQKTNLTELEFGTEYDAKFIEDSDSYFNQELIDKCTADYELGITHPHSIFILGVDFARLGEDETTFVIIEIDMKKRVKVNFIDSLYKKKLTEAVGYVRILDEKYHFEKIYLDETGMGGGPTDFLIEEMGDRVEGMMFSLKSKQNMYSNLKKMMEQSNIYFPPHRKLLYQLADLRYVVASSGDLKIHHSERGHDDYPDALALAAWYFKSEEVEEYEPMWL